jgi:CHAD domain-containing protein
MPLSSPTAAVHDQGSGRLAATLSARMRRAAATIARDKTALIGNCGERNVHALRVATRRARALLWSAKPWVVTDIYKESSKRLRRLSATLAPARDLDVLADILTTQIAQQADLSEKQLSQLRARIAPSKLRARRELRATIRSNDFDKRVRRICDLFRHRTSLRKTTPDSADPWRQRILRSVAKLDKRARAARTTQLHALRVRAKRCRYAIELLGAPAPRSIIRRLRRIQAVLGRYCDARLAALWLDTDRAAFGKRLQGRLRRAAHQIVARRARRSKRLLSGGCAAVSEDSGRKQAKQRK